jgi:hypothetical protein
VLLQVNIPSGEAGIRREPTGIDPVDQLEVAGVAIRFGDPEPLDCLGVENALPSACHIACNAAGDKAPARTAPPMLWKQRSRSAYSSGRGPSRAERDLR